MRVRHDIIENAKASLDDFLKWNGRTVSSITFHNPVTDTSLRVFSTIANLLIWPGMRNFCRSFRLTSNLLDEESKKLKFRDLTGPEKVKLFKGFKVSELISAEEELPIKKTREQIQALWDKFFEIYEMLRSDRFSDAECNAMVRCSAASCA